VTLAHSAPPGRAPRNRAKTHGALPSSRFGATRARDCRSTTGCDTLLAQRFEKH
jgi:hypothetical protein